MKIQLSIIALEDIISRAKNKQAHEDSASSIIEFELIKKCQTHLGTDTISVSVKNAYAECISSEIYSNVY